MTKKKMNGRPSIMVPWGAESRSRPGLWAILAAATAFVVGILALSMPAQNAVPGTQASQAPSSAGSGEGEKAGTDSPAPAISTALPKGKKLVLKDGTDQVVREYERQGDRVRYYSLERGAWEEIPSSLVDWDATDKAEAEQEVQLKALADKSKAAEAIARVANIDADKSVEVRPNVFLPDDVGLYVLDDQTVISMQQDRASSHLNKGREAERIITGVPFISTKREIDIAGKQAKTRIRSTDPEFYFRTADGRDPDIALFRAEVKEDKREVLTMKTDLVGQDTYKANDIFLREWNAARGVYRFTLDQAVPPGEYAFVEASNEGITLYVWDFGIDAPKKDAKKH